MKDEENKRKTLEGLYKKYKDIKEEMKPIGESLGWYDEDGTTKPLECQVSVEMSEEEKQEAQDKEKIGKELEFIKLQIKRNNIAKQIVKLEDELGIPFVESKTGKGGIIRRQKSYD